LAVIEVFGILKICRFGDNGPKLMLEPSEGNELRLVLVERNPQIKLNLNAGEKNQS